MLLASMAKKESGKDHFTLVLLLYLGTVFFHGMGNPAIILATFLALLGLFLLFHSALPKKELFAGATFALAAFSQLVILPFLLLVFCFFLYQGHVGKNQQRQSRKQLLTAIAWLALPFLLLLILFLFLFPNFWIYTLLHSTVYTEHPPQIENPLLYGAKMLFFTNLFRLHAYNFTPYLILLLSLYLFWKWKGLYEAIGSIGLLLVWMNIAQYLEIGLVRYLIPYMSAALISMTLWLSAWEKRGTRQTAIALFVLLLLLPKLSYAYLLWEKNELQERMERPLSFIPDQQGPILAEDFTEGHYRRFLSQYYPYALDKLELVKPPYPIDPAHVGGLVKYGMVENISQWREALEHKHDARHREILEQYRKGIYSLVIIGPPYFQELLAMRDQLTKEERAQYCKVFIPSLRYFQVEEARKLHYLFLREQEQCKEIWEKTKEYFEQEFDAICRKSRYAAVLLKEVIFRLNQFPIEKECDEGGKVVGRFGSVSNSMDEYYAYEGSEEEAIQEIKEYVASLEQEG